MPRVLLESKEIREVVDQYNVGHLRCGQLLYNECEVSLRYYGVLPVKWIIVSDTLIV